MFYCLMKCEGEEKNKSEKKLNLFLWQLQTIFSKSLVLAINTHLIKQEGIAIEMLFCI